MNKSFLDAIENNNLEVIKELLKRVEPSAENNEAIRWVSGNGHLKVVKELLKDKRVDPSADNNYAIREASYNGHLEVVKELLKDPRVDWRKMSNKMKTSILKEERNLLKKTLAQSHLSLEKSSPQVKIERKNELVSKSTIPKSLIKRTVYLAPYQELCSVLTGNIPPVKLIALADILNITYDANISWKDLCGKVQQTLFLLL